MDELVTKLKRICDAVVKAPTLQAKDGFTYCNMAVQLICKHMGYDGFEGLLANQIYEKCDTEFKKVDPKWAAEFAATGGVAIAAVRGSPHGHVAVVYPGPTTYSNKWKQEVPLVANVGKTNGVIGANWSFREKPSYYLIVPKTVEEMHEVRGEERA